MNKIPQTKESETKDNKPTNEYISQNEGLKWKTINKNTIKTKQKTKNTKLNKI